MVRQLTNLYEIYVDILANYTTDSLLQCGHCVPTSETYISFLCITFCYLSQ